MAYSGSSKGGGMVFWGIGRGTGDSRSQTQKGY